MRRFICAIVIFAAVIFVCNVSVIYLESVSDILCEDLTKAEEYAKNNDFKSCSATIDDAYTLWDDKAHSIGSIVRHQEIDEIYKLFETTLQYAKSEDLTEYMSSSKELGYLVLHLPDLEKPSIKNIF